MVTVTRTDTFCISTDRVYVSYTGLPDIFLGEDTTLCLEQKFVLDAYHPLAEEYKWQDGSVIDSLVVNEAGNYNVVLTSFCGTVSDQISISFENCHEVFIPNAFSPNYDGFNDFFMLLDGGDIRNIKYFVIFDRWGRLVFEQRNILPNVTSSAWDGQGWPVGVYAWLLMWNFGMASQSSLKGTYY